MRKVVVQRGSVKVFTIVGIVLVALSLLALYVVGRNFYSEQVPPMFVSDETSDTAEVADDEAEVASEDEQGETESTDTGVSMGVAPTPSPSSSTASEALPHSGPGDSLVAPVAIAALTTSAVAYVSSVRRLRGL